MKQSIKLHFYLKEATKLIILILQPFFLIDVLNVSDASGKVAFSKSEKKRPKRIGCKYK
jgi:hypothetical protein